MQEIEAEIPEVQGHPQPHVRFEAGLGCMRLCQEGEEKGKRKENRVYTHNKVVDFAIKN